MKGVIYTRVSSDDQVQGMSLDFQRDDCLSFAKEKNITVAKIFEERGESAKFADRPELLKLLEYCRKNKREVDALILWKIDRLSRNQMDYYFIKRTLLEYGISILSATERSLDGSSSISQKIFETFSALQAEIDNTTRRERSMRGMEAKIASGIYPWKAPLGYQMSRSRVVGGKKTAADEPDPQRFPLIQKLFRTVIDQHIHTSTQLSRLANSWGLRTNKGQEIYPQLIDSILGNRIYAGLLLNPWTGEYFKGLHQPVLSVEDFHRVQRIRKGDKHDIIKRRVRDEHPDFPLRKFVKCGHCDNPLTGSWSKGRNRKYAYYHCSKKKCAVYAKTVRKAVLEEEFQTALSKITPTDEALKTFKEATIAVWEREQQDMLAITKNHKQHTDKVKKHLKGLLIMKERDLLTDKEYISRKEELNSELATAKVEVSDAKISKWDLDNLLEYARHFVADLPRQWFDMEPECRRRFQQTVFPQGILYDLKTGFRTTKIGSIYCTIQQSDGSETNLVRLIRINWNQILEDLRIIYSVTQEID